MLTLLKTNKAFMALVVVSLAIIPSIFIGPKAMGVVFLLYIGVIAWNMMPMFKLVGLKEVSEVLDEKSAEAKSEKKWLQFAAYGAAVPLMGVGLLWVLITIIFLIFVF